MVIKALLRVLILLGSLLIAWYPVTGKAATLLGSGNRPNIAADGSNVYVVWDAGSDVPLRRSMDGGNNFSPAVSLALSPGIGGAGEPDVAVSGSNVYVVWVDSNAPGGSDVIFRRSTDGGATFSAPIDLSNTPQDGSEELPRIAVNGSVIHVVWQIGSGAGTEVLYTKSNDSGLTFSTPVNLSNSPGSSSQFPVVAKWPKRVYCLGGSYYWQ
jgi:hypothetical protein